MRWSRVSVSAMVLGAWLAASFAQQPPAAPPPAASPPAVTPPPRAPAPEEGAPEATPPVAAGDASEDEFIPTEELQPDAAVTFPVDI